MPSSHITIADIGSAKVRGVAVTPWWPALVFAALAYASQASGFDLWVSDRLYSVASRHFILRGQAAERWLHDGGRWLIIALACAMAVATVMGWLRARRSLGSADQARGMAAALSALVLTTATVAALKAMSHVDCPCDLARYGGSHAYLPLIEWHARLMSPFAKTGRCFPGGHSSGAFGLWGLTFIVKTPLRRRWAIAGVTLLGVVFAVSQWARGAHFVSHDLTTAAIAWLIGWTLCGRNSLDVGQLSHAGPRPLAHQGGCP